MAWSTPACTMPTCVGPQTQSEPRWCVHRRGSTADRTLLPLGAGAASLVFLARPGGDLAARVGM